MDPAHARTIIEALRQKTVANGCTPGEAAAAAARAMLWTIRYGSPATPEPKPEPAPISREAAQRAWSAQFDLTPYCPEKSLGQRINRWLATTFAALRG